MNPLVTYIEREKEKGFSDSLMRKKLEAAGYTEEDIVTAFREHERYHHYQKVIGTIVDQEAHHKWLILTAFIFGLILLTAFLATILLSLDWSALFSPLLEKLGELGKEKVYIEPQTEQDCSIFTRYREKEQCFLKVAALQDSTDICLNMTSKVMRYECKTEVWKKNYCNFLILTNQSTAGC